MTNESILAKAEEEKEAAIKEAVEADEAKNFKSKPKKPAKEENGEAEKPAEADAAAEGNKEE